MQCSSESGRNQIYTYVPENFRPEEILPPHLHKFADDARYLVGLIYEKRLLDFRDKQDYVPLKSEYLRKLIHFDRFGEILKALLENGVLETDKRFIVGKKARGYRLGPTYRGVIHRRREVEDIRLRRRIVSRRLANEENLVAEHFHLYAHLQKLRIDREEAIAHIREAYPDEENFLTATLMVDKIFYRDWFFRVDDYGRVHTNATNLKSSLRKRLTVDAEPLVELDLANSQPFFLGLLLKTYQSGQQQALSPPSGNTAHSLDLCFLCTNSTNFNYGATFPSGERLLRPLLCGSTTSEGYIYQPDLAKYLSLVQHGELYQHLFEEWNIPPEKRADFKQLLFKDVLFSRNSKRSRFRTKFAAEFPTVYKIIQQIKAKDYRRLAHLLQRTESRFIIHGVARRFMLDAPKVFLTTVHDSLLVQAQHAEMARRFIIEEFRDWGLVPTIRIKHFQKTA